MGTAALDLAGKVVWKQTEVKYTPIHGNGGSPILIDGLLVFSCDGAQDPFITALDAANGDALEDPGSPRRRNSFPFPPACHRGSVAVHRSSVADPVSSAAIGRWMEASCGAWVMANVTL
jgi:hypothetical protein